MSQEDLQQEMSNWISEYTGPNGEMLEGDKVEGTDGEKEKEEEKKKEKEKEVIDLEGEEGKKRNPIVSRSGMWEHFSKVFHEGQLIKANCNYCKKDIAAHPVFNGTSAMHKHFNCCKSNPHVESKQGVLSISQGTGVGTWKFDPELLRSAFAEMVIEDEEPFAKGEKPGFRKFMSVACPRFTLPSRRTCTRDAVQLYFEQKAKLKKKFKNIAIEFASQLMVGHHSSKRVT